MEEHILRLPIKKIEVKGFSHQAALLSILMAYDECKPWICNNFIQIFSLKNLSNSWRSGTLDFFYMDYNDFRSYEYSANPWIRWYDIPIDIIRDDIIKFILERLNNMFYVYLEVDTYYISLYNEYQKTHRIHWLYICGYDSNNFTFMCFDNFAGGAFKLRDIDWKEIVEAYKGSYMQYLKQEKNVLCPSVGIFKVILCSEEKNNPEVKNINLKRIVCLLENYLGETSKNLPYKNSEYYIYGIEVYRELIKFTDEIKEKLDIRAFYAMKDHKALMKWRLEYLEDKYSVNFSEEISGYIELTNKLSKIILLIVKYNLAKKKDLLQKKRMLKKVREYLFQCVAEERELTLKTIASLKKISLNTILDV